MRPPQAAYLHYLLQGKKRKIFTKSDICYHSVDLGYLCTETMPECLDNFVNDIDQVWQEFDCVDLETFVGSKRVQVVNQQIGVTLIMNFSRYTPVILIKERRVVRPRECYLISILNEPLLLTTVSENDAAHVGIAWQLKI